MRPDRALALITLLALALRVPPMFDELWLDEVWTVLTARGAKSVASLLTDDPNHHHLYTLLVYWMDAGEGWLAVRTPALLAGVGVVVLGGLVAGLRNRTEGVVTAGLLALSWPLIHYSSEARGYSLAIFFVLATWYAAARFVAGRQAVWVVTGWICAPLALLSQLTSLHGLVAVAVWLAIRLRSQAAGPGRAIADATLVFAVPAACATGLYLAIFRHIYPPPGVGSTPLGAVLAAASIAGGGPLDGAPSRYAGITVLSLLAASTAWAWRTNRSEWVIYAVGVFVSPALVIASGNYADWTPRYHLVSMTLGLMSVAGPVVASLRARGRRRIAVAVLAGAFVVGNAINLARLYEWGRGSYLGVFRAMVETSPGEEVTLSSRDDFQYRMLLAFYRPYLPATTHLRYIGFRELPPVGTDFLIWHVLRDDDGPPSRVVAPNGAGYVLVAAHPYPGLSGWHSFVYRNAARRTGISGMPAQGEKHR